MQTHAAAITAPSSPTRRLICRAGDDDDGGGGGSGHLFFFSAPASPVHYILRSPPSSTTTTLAADGTDYGCGAGAGDFEFAGEGAATMSSAEELFVAGRIRVGCLSPIRQEAGFGEPEEEEDCVDGDVGGERPQPRRARSASPPRSPHHLAKTSTEPSDSLASSSSSSSTSSSSSSSSAKNTRRRISLRDLLLGGTANNDTSSSVSVPAAGERSSGFWPPSIWRPPSSRSTKKTTATLALPCPCPAPQPARRSTSSERSSSAAAPRRRTTSLPYRQGLVLGCLGFGARSYGLAKSMHPLSSR